MCYLISDGKLGDSVCGAHAGLVTQSTVSTKTGTKGGNGTLCCKFDV